MTSTGANGTPDDPATASGPEVGAPASSGESDGPPGPVAAVPSGGADGVPPSPSPAPSGPAPGRRGRKPRPAPAPASAGADGRSTGSPDAAAPEAGAAPGPASDEGDATGPEAATAITPDEVATNGHHPDAALSAVSPPQPDEPGAPDLRYVTVGAVRAAGQGAGWVAGRAIGVTRAMARPALTVAGGLVPGPVRHAAVERLRQLEDGGRAAVHAAAADGAQAAERMADRVGRDPLVIKLVDEIVGHVLPGILERLANEPDQVREIVQGQSRGMVEEVAQAARTRAVAGDEAVDRLVGRFLRRRPAGRHPAG